MKSYKQFFVEVQIAAKFLLRNKILSFELTLPNFKNALDLYIEAKFNPGFQSFNTTNHNLNWNYFFVNSSDSQVYFCLLKLTISDLYAIKFQLKT